MLPPYQSSNSGRWYSGTANAIFQNMAFIDRYDPEYVLILSGDHIYKMDYALMLDYHISKKADLPWPYEPCPWRRPTASA